MSVEDLRKNMAKANLEKQRAANQDSRSPLEDPKIWEAARKAFNSGWRQPEPRFYVIISPDSLVSTPEKLQQIAKMTSPPKVINTTYTGLHGGNPEAPQMRSDGKPQNVSVCAIGRKELTEIRSKTECVMSLLALINGQPKGAILVKGLKKVQANNGDQGR
ncbi:hypothetical protein KVR01_005760 [Diaporthe batatas]|uniref:uncharacterized protein n=1 Tax=Diaporthe batatas TaxID=748121 RepID=UPI001D054CB5|nr:uncharacterized protein KVR01_005760 [Diaporthe batatas]KAG8163842.1 hypothetical protein KVR01_005760 [Diaporthe batatas]